MKYIKTFEAKRDKSLITELDLSKKNTPKLKKLKDLSEYVNLKTLICWANELTSLPELPNSLEELWCSDNQLISLPKLPESLKELDCQNNQLPFNNLDGYKKWYQENKSIIEKDGLEYAYDLYQSMNKYNI